MSRSVTAPPETPAPAGQRQASLRNILVNVGWLLGGKGASAVLSTVYLTIVTRSLGVEGFGQFSLALGAGQAVASFVAFQSWQIIVRYGMPHLHAGRHDALARLVRFTALLDVAAAISGAALIAGGMWLLAGRFGWSSDFAAQATAFGVVLVISTHWTPIGVLRLHDRFATAVAADTVTPLARFVGAVAVWLWHPSVIGFLAVWAIAELLTALAYWVTALRMPGIRWRLSEPLRWQVLKADNPRLANYAVATNLSSSLDLGGKQLAVLIVALIVTPAAAGGYRLAQQLAQSLAKISQMLGRAIFPELVRSRGDASDTGDFDGLLRRTVRMTAIGGGLVFLLLLTIGRPMLGLIAGPAFLPAYPVLLVLGTAAAIDFAAVGFEPAVVALGRPGKALRLRFVSSGVLIGLMLILPRWYGALGAGFAVLAGSIVSFALLWHAVRRRVRG